MRLLSDEDCRREVDPLLLRLFRPVDLASNPGFARWAERGFVIDGLETPFTDEVLQRAAFQTIATLNSSQCRAICSAARQAGDTGLYAYSPAKMFRLDQAASA